MKIFRFALVALFFFLPTALCLLPTASAQTPTIEIIRTLITLANETPCEPGKVYDFAGEQYRCVRGRTYTKVAAEAVNDTELRRQIVAMNKSNQQSVISNQPNKKRKRRVVKHRRVR